MTSRICAHDVCLRGCAEVKQIRSEASRENLSQETDFLLFHRWAVDHPRTPWSPVDSVSGRESNALAASGAVSEAAQMTSETSWVGFEQPDCDADDRGRCAQSLGAQPATEPFAPNRAADSENPKKNRARCLVGTAPFFIRAKRN